MAEKIVKKKFNPFEPSVSVPGKTFTEKEYVVYKKIDHLLSHDDKDPTKFITETKIVAVERIPIHEEINSHRDQVGLKNLLRGITTSAQMSEFVEAHQAQPGEFDLTKLPDTSLEMEDYIERLNSIWNDIPSELRRDMTKEEFLRTINAQKINDYAQKVIDEQLKKEIKEEK